MKVGIFIQNYFPDSGGVNTILETIKEGIKQSPMYLLFGI